MIDYKKYKVLYVEDEPEVYTSTMKFLKKFFGDNVIGAKDGQAGLKESKSKDFDIVITDLKMPKLNGHEMLTEIRKTNPDIKVMILTASDSHMDYSLSKSDSYMVKPIQFNKFVEEIKTLIENMD